MENWLGEKEGNKIFLSLSFPGDQPGYHVLSIFTECWAYLASGYVTYKFAAYIFSPMTSIWLILYLELELWNGLWRLSTLNYSSIPEECVLSADPVIAEKPMESIRVESIHAQFLLTEVYKLKWNRFYLFLRGMLFLWNGSCSKAQRSVHIVEVLYCWTKSSLGNWLICYHLVPTLTLPIPFKYHTMLLCALIRVKCIWLRKSFTKHALFPLLWCFSSRGDLTPGSQQTCNSGETRFNLQRSQN